MVSCCIGAGSESLTGIESHQTEGGIVEEHECEEANRLTDSGITYDPLGNVTKLPSGDAENQALVADGYVLVWNEMW